MIIKSPCILDLFLIWKWLSHVVVPALIAEDMAGEVGDTDLLVTRPVRTPDQPVLAAVLMAGDGVDVTPGVTARVSEVTRMLYPLDDGGCHLTDTVRHG